MTYSLCRNCGRHILLIEKTWCHTTEYVYDSIGHTYYTTYCDVLGRSYKKATPKDKADNFTEFYEICK